MMNEDERDNVNLYRCPICRYLISELELELAKYDFVCPRCHKASLSFFYKIV